MGCPRLACVKESKQVGYLFSTYDNVRGTKLPQFPQFFQFVITCDHMYSCVLCAVGRGRADTKLVQSYDALLLSFSILCGITQTARRQLGTLGVRTPMPAVFIVCVTQLARESSANNKAGISVRAQLAPCSLRDHGIEIRAQEHRHSEEVWCVPSPVRLHNQP